jgi:two-component system NtrC family sensor kinase
LLPAATGTAPQTEATEEDSAAGPKKVLAGRRVLVVDDEEPLRSVLGRFLRSLGAEVREADGGHAAISAVRDESFDALVLDVRMPDLDGVQVYRWLCGEVPELARRTIILTGDISDLEGELGVDSCRVLVKPVELAELKAAAARVLEDVPMGEG